MKNGGNKKIAVAISYITMMIQFVVVFLVTPYLLNRLGKTEYGLYQLVSSTVSYLSLLGFGFSASYLRFFSRFDSKKDNEGIAVLNGMFMTAFLMMSSLCILLGIIFSYNIPFIFGNSITASQYSTTRLMIILLSCNMALAFPKSIFVCNVTAHEKFVFQKSLLLFIEIVSPFLQILFVFIFPSAISVSVAIIISSIIDVVMNVIYNMICLKMKFDFRHFDWQLMRELLGFTFFIFLNQILDLLSSTSIDNYLVGRIKGTDDVTVYSMGGKISQMFYSIAAPISTIFIPTIYKIVEQTRDYEKLSRVFTKVGKIQFSILYFILIGFILWGKQFMLLWIGEGYNDSYYIAIILMGSLIVALSQNIGIEIQRAVNKHKARSIVYLIIDIANVIISIPLIRYLGAVGASVGTAIAMILGTIIFMNIYYQITIGIDVRDYWLNLIKIVVYTIPCILVVIFLKVFMKDITLMNSIIQGFSFFVIYVVIIYFAILDENERKSVGIIKRLKRGNK